MVAMNPHLKKLPPSYLFTTIKAKVAQLQQQYPQAELVRLDVGNPTYPIGLPIVRAFSQAAQELAEPKTYRGYGPECGDPSLKQHIATHLYDDQLDADEIFISDGAKCDAGRLQLLFSSDSRVAIPDPSYPVYIDTSIAAGKDSSHSLFLFSCLPSRNFFPDLSAFPPVDIIYVCSPNNPTGMAASYDQLNSLVEFALQHNSIILFDAAYSAFIQSRDKPQTIFSLPNAKKVAIEMGSFSKCAGFAGVRLGWSVVPKELTFSDGSSVHAVWKRVVSTFFNGASHFAQKGGLSLFTEEGKKAIEKTVQYYLENAFILKEAIEKRGYATFGGEDSPFVWVDLKGEPSWEKFEQLLNRGFVVSTPGKGFGESGEGFLRFSAFGRREEMKMAASRLQQLL